MTTASTFPRAAVEISPVLVLHRSTRGGVCRHCQHRIRLFADVGWVDTTPPFYGGCYDMCTRSLSGQHEPV
jgi:hypothetical protein